MPLIKPRTNRVKTVRHICRLQEPNRDALVLYARFIGDTADYVLNQLIDTTIAKDREFVTWRAAQTAEPPVPAPPTTSQPLPPYPAPETREELFVILGERHRQTSPSRASAPTWLTIPERGLYTGMVIVGAIGTGKTSACMYPYVEQLLGYRASDPARKIGGLILEVKGDFCCHVRDLLTHHGRADDYIEVSLASPYRY